MTDNDLLDRLICNRTPLYYAIIDDKIEEADKHRTIEGRITRILERRGYIVTIRNFTATIEKKGN